MIKELSKFVEYWVKLNKLNETRIKDVMTQNIISVDVNDDIATAARLIIENGIGSVIVKDNNIPIGIITKRDIVERVVLDCHNPCKVKVKEIVTSQLITILY